MVKKAKAAKPKPITRTSSMERTVREAQLFLDSGKKKKILKTITMAMTIAEGTAAVKTLGKRVPKKKLSTRPPKRVVAGSKIPTKPAKRSRAAKPAKPARAARSSKSASAAPASVSIVASGAIGDLKKTIFKAPSKDNLPLPAFGFIDVCFCVDATGSMVGELAQVQSTIVAIIQKISNKVRTEGITLRFAIVTYRDHPPQ